MIVDPAANAPAHSSSRASTLAPARMIKASLGVATTTSNSFPTTPFSVTTTTTFSVTTTTCFSPTAATSFSFTTAC